MWRVDKAENRVLVSGPTPQERPMKQSGRVKWFNASKGFGCIEAAGGEEIAVHAQDILCHGFRSLEEGQTVEFEVAQGPNGPQAEKVIALEETAE